MIKLEMKSAIISSVFCTILCFNPESPNENSSSFKRSWILDDWMHLFLMKTNERELFSYQAKIVTEFWMIFGDIVYDLIV